MARATHIRSQFKTKARSIIVPTFGFEMDGSDLAKENNRKLFVDLKTSSAFIYCVSNASLMFWTSNELTIVLCSKEFRPKRDGVYRNRGVQQLINEVLFNFNSRTSQMGALNGKSIMNHFLTLRMHSHSRR